jgi:hypothetical protein
MEKFIETYFFTSAGRKKAVRIIEIIVYIATSIFFVVMAAAFLMRYLSM